MLDGTEPGMTTEPARPVPKALGRFETDFAAFAKAFSAGRYVLWLGSGISRDRVPNVSALLESVIEGLRAKRDAANTECPYGAALGAALALVGLTDEEMASVDLTAPIADWPMRDRIIRALVMQYSKVLDVTVGDEAEDYLVWTGLDVPHVYGAPDLEPDVEHYCIAVLMLEGLASSAVTANWDGLLEMALRELAPGFDDIGHVVVRPEDFREANGGIEVIKFHGCAVRAGEDEDTYRPLLIARESQISTWTAQPEHQAMKKRLEVLYTDNPTLMIGLSAQDANLHTVFATAIQDLARPWPAANPALVLSEPSLQQHHEHILKITYKSNYQGNATAIAKSALLGAYGKPTLLALVLWSIAGKFAALLDRVPNPAWDAADMAQLGTDLCALRDAAAQAADDDPWTFVHRVIDVVQFALTVFRTGRVRASGDGRYIPISDRPIPQAVHTPDFPTLAFGHFSMVLALIGRGQKSGRWTAIPGDGKAPGEGVLRLVTGHRDARVFFVKDNATSTTLELTGLIDDTDEDVLIVVADLEPPVSARSPRSQFGRDGKTRAGRFSVATQVAETTSASELYESFKLAGGF